MAWRSSPVGLSGPIRRTLIRRGELVASGSFLTSPFARLQFCDTDLDDGSGTGLPDGGVTIDDLLYDLARFEVGC